MLATQHANGQLDDPLVEYEIREIEHAIQLERESAGTTYSSFLKTPGNRKRLFLVLTIAFGGQWDGVGVVFYYIVVCRVTRLASQLTTACAALAKHHETHHPDPSARWHHHCQLALLVNRRLPGGKSRPPTIVDLVHLHHGCQSHHDHRLVRNVRKE